MPSTARQTTSPTRLEFYFDPVPDALRPFIAAGDLLDRDALVYGRLLRQRRPNGSAPGIACTKSKLADEFGCHRLTIQRSFGRLKLHGLMEHVLDATDRSGYRVEFPSLEPKVRLFSPPGGDTAVYPPGIQPCVPPPAAPHKERAPGINSETELRDNDEFARETEAPSSSSFAALQANESRPISPKVPQIAKGTISAPADMLAFVVALLIKLFGWKEPYAQAQVDRAVGTWPLEWIHRALVEAERKQKRVKDWSWGYVEGILKNWRAVGGPPPEPPPKPVAAPPKSPGQVWVETLEADGFRLVVLPDGRFDARRIRGDAPLNQEAAAMLKGQFRDSALKYLAEREGGVS